MAREGGGAAFGDELRRERERRGMALEAICDATKVPAKHIRALEAGAFADLPGGVLRRGFVRSYLGALGLEEGVWMKRFEQSCRESGVSDRAETDWVAFAENVKNSRTAAHRRRGMTWVAVGVLLAVLAFAWWVGWRVATHRRLLPALLLCVDVKPGCGLRWLHQPGLRRAVELPLTVTLSAPGT